MNEYTWQPEDTGTYPSDTVPEDTEVHTMSHDEVTQLIEQLKNARVIEPDWKENA